MSTPPTRPLRLLLGSNSVQVGGMEEHLRLIATGLDQDQFEVFVVMPDWDETNWFAETMEDHAADVSLITPDRRPGGRGAIREALRLIGHVRRAEIDVAHLHGTSYHGMLLMVLAVRLGGVKQIFLTEHLAPMEPVGRLGRYKRRVLEAMVSQIVAVSHRNRASRIDHLGGTPEDVIVVRNGINVERFDNVATPDSRAELRRSLSIADDAQIVGTAIRLEKGKGVFDLLDAFHSVAQRFPRAHLLVAGDGKLRASFEAKIDDLDLDERVTMTGFVTDPRPLIDLMDVFVLPVPFGSASIALLEAMAMATPCIISFGGEGEAVVPGESGYWATPNDPSSIAEHICQLLGDEDLRQLMAKNSRQRVVSAFSSTAMTDQLAKLYANA